MTFTTQLARAIALFAGLAFSTSAVASSDIASDRYFKHSARVHTSLMVARERPATEQPAKEGIKAASRRVSCSCHSKG